MSSDVAIHVRGLSKCYLTYEKPHHRLLQMLARGRKYYREFWALRDVTFDVKRGEVLGIIGRNGAGKSTLLQAICGTVTPTAGDVEIKGRVAALLELGAGFNPEFSGRENVFLNAAILGMTREEIEARFDAIVAFSELEDFINEPVKTYSSGMFVRLAFSVAVHVDPDILIVDEALSVGDMSFRNKCMERIQQLVAKGVTILFVTHDAGTLQMLCTRVIWLDHGQIEENGEPVQVSQNYYAALTGHNREPEVRAVATGPVPVQHDTGKALFTEVKLENEPGRIFAPGDTLRIKFALLAKEDLGPIVLNISIYRSDGDWVVGQTSRDAGVIWAPAKSGELRKGVIELAPLSLAPGDYHVSVGACTDDYSICYAITDLSLKFSVRSPVTHWGKFIHPSEWIPEDGDRMV